MSANRPRDVVFHLQIALSAIGISAIDVDGLMGPQTYDAYHELPDQLKDMIRELYVDSSPYLSDRLKKRQAPASDYAVIGRSEVEHLIPKIASRMDVPSSYLSLMLRQENLVSRETIKTSFTGTFRGIAQFGSRTWGTILERYPELNLASFETGTLDSEMSLLAAAALYRENKLTFLRAFPTKPYTDTVAYLFHQQGAPAAIEYLRTGVLVYPEQSVSSINLFSQERVRFA